MSNPKEHCEQCKGVTKIQRGIDPNIHTAALFIAVMAIISLVLVLVKHHQ